MKQYELNKSVFVFLVLSLSISLAGCCKRGVKNKSKVNKPAVQNEKAVPVVVSQESEELLEKTGLNYSIDRDYIPSVERRVPLQPSGLGGFEDSYLRGVDLLEADKYDEAMAIFKELLERFPDGEEASIASLCIAEVFFRNKNNEAALKMYEEIIKKYPGTQAAMNAAEGIKYLKTFEKYEKNYIAPEQEALRRRGR